VRTLPDVKSLKSCADGERVSFRARALRVWEVGGLRMCLAGDPSALMRVELGATGVQEGVSYEFHNALVRTYEGGWHSVSIAYGGSAERLAEEVPVPQDPAYIERTFRILSGVQRKKGRAEGRLPPWQHPTKKGHGDR
jgi:hypothetical protein